MADEKKTYLVNVKHNLGEYIDAAVKAKEEVDKLKLANKQMSKDTPREEVEKNNAALKAAEKIYRDAQKEVQTFTAATKSETGSRKQLGEVLSLQQKALGKLGNAYIKDAEGIMRLNPLYVEQTKKIKATKDAIIQYDKAQGDGRSSVGLYSEAIEGSAAQFAAIPGPIGIAANAVSRYSKILLANPIVLIITAIIGAFALLAKGFKNSQVLMDIWDATVAGVNATIKVLIDRISNAAEFLGNLFSKELRESRKAAKELNDELIGIEETMSRREKRELRRANKKGIFEEIKEESAAARQLKKDTQALEDAEIAFITTKARLTREIQEKRNAVQDELLTDKERLASINEAIALQEQLTAKEVEFANERARISQLETDMGNSTREELRKNEELQASAVEITAAGLKAQKRMLTERLTLINKLTTEEKKAIESELKAKETAAKTSQDILDKEIEAIKKANEKKRKEREKAGVDRMNELATQYQMEQEAALLNQENELQLRELQNENIFAIQRDRLQIQYEEEIKAANKIGADINVIDKKYAVYRTEIAKAEADNKLSLYRDFAGNIAIIFGESTAIGKVAAVASATIDTYAAATKALATYPPPFSYIAMAAAIATGLANVKKIISVKSGLPGDSSRGPTSISSSPAAQRTFASQVAPSFVTQPQLTQTQLNAAPQGNLLTASDIAAAFANIPAPIVTVEDINARIASKNKVEVRANI